MVSVVDSQTGRRLSEQEAAQYRTIVLLHLGPLALLALSFTMTWLTSFPLTLDIQSWYFAYRPLSTLVILI